MGCAGGGKSLCSLSPVKTEGWVRLAWAQGWPGLLVTVCLERGERQKGMRIVHLNLESRFFLKSLFSAV